jgi:hypothetical protein
LRNDGFWANLPLLCHSCSRLADRVYRSSESKSGPAGSSAVAEAGGGLRESRQVKPEARRARPHAPGGVRPR